MIGIEVKNQIFVIFTYYPYLLMACIYLQHLINYFNIFLLISTFFYFLGTSNETLGTFYDRQLYRRYSYR